MKNRSLFNLIVGLITIVGAAPLMAQEEQDETGCIKACDTGAVCCSTFGVEVCCSYNVHQCCHANTTQCYTSYC